MDASTGELWGNFRMKEQNHSGWGKRAGALTGQRNVPGSVVAAALLLAPLAGQAQSQGSGLEEIVVTATRREESVQDVPVSIAVFGQAQMDAQGVKGIDDIARLSPSIQFTRGGGGFGSALGNRISIRGLGSNSGPATTGVYIDDTPTQVGATIASGSFTDNAYPLLFDIERVEVLAGPQGTLFGSSSEGGAVRFIQPGPNMTKSSLYARSELSNTEYGAPSYEAGVAGGAPIVDGTLGFRGSVWSRHTGGYIDNVDYYTGRRTKKDANDQDAISARFALGWQATDDLMITPSFYYQKIENNGGGAFYFPSDNVGRNPVMVPGPFGPSPDSVYIRQPYGNPNNGDYVDLHQLKQYSDQTIKLAAVKVEWTLPHDMQLFSNTSYYKRDQSGITDFASLEVAFWDGTSLWPVNPSWVFPGHDKQGNEFFTQEIRLQSTDPDARLKWVVGAFYSDNETTDMRNVENTHYPLPQIFGWPLADGLYSFKNTTSLTEKQKAVFGQADFNVVGGLIATVGLRYSEFDTDFLNHTGGPIAGANWPGPNGQPNKGSASASVVIPKYMVSYKTDDTLTYVSATKGFRNGGANAAINNPACRNDLAELGLTSVPLSYDPDELWSYELGTKLQMLDRRLVVNAAVYQYDWDDMITNQSLQRCTLSYTTNIGTARGRGFEFSVQYLPIDDLTLGLSVGRYRLEATEARHATGPNSAFRVKDGQLLGDGGNLNANAQYTFNLAGLEAYARTDYTYTRRPSLLNEPGTVTYEDDPRMIFETPGYGLANVRFGVNVANWDVSIFANNVTNKQVFFKDRATVGFTSTPTSVVTATTLTPRTYGVTAVYRY